MAGGDVVAGGAAASGTRGARLDLPAIFKMPHPQFAWSWDRTDSSQGCNQSSSISPGTRENSSVLWVTRIPPAALVIAPIHRSGWLMMVPALSSELRMST